MKVLVGIWLRDKQSTAASTAVHKRNCDTNGIATKARKALPLLKNPVT